MVPVIGIQSNRFDNQLNMLWRYLAFIAFVIGGAATLVTFWLLSTLGHIGAGMSSVATPAPASEEALIPWFTVAYFIVSSIGILVFRDRRILRYIAFGAHLMILVTYFLFCFEIAHLNDNKAPLDFIKIAIVICLSFSPWITIWYWILFKRKD